MRVADTGVRKQDEEPQTGPRRVVTTASLVADRGLPNPCPKPP